MRITPPPPPFSFCFHLAAAGSLMLDPRCTVVPPSPDSQPGYSRDCGTPSLFSSNDEDYPAAVIAYAGSTRSSEIERFHAETKRIAKKSEPVFHVPVPPPKPDPPVLRPIGAIKFYGQATCDFFDACVLPSGAIDVKKLIGRNVSLTWFSCFFAGRPILRTANDRIVRSHITFF